MHTKKLKHMNKQKFKCITILEEGRKNFHIKAVHSEMRKQIDTVVIGR